jgi:SAM-dependent methyltransferase
MSDVPPEPVPGFVVLQSRSEIRAARERLRHLGLGCVTPPLVRRLRRYRLLGGVDVGDVTKSWDVLRTVDLVRRVLPTDAPVLDIGAFASEVPCALHRAGYTRISAIDLDPRIRAMPHAESIRYVEGDFMACPFPAASFDAITSISVIEHGFDGPRLLAEVSRLLRPGGLFAASVDYWEEKIDTSSVRAFGMDWRIFSREEAAALLLQAEAHSLRPCGAADFGCGERVVEWNGRRYTFAWMALRKV